MKFHWKNGWIVMSLLAAFFLAACGGGGGIRPLRRCPWW